MSALEVEIFQLFFQRTGGVRFNLAIKILY